MVANILPCTIEPLPEKWRKAKDFEDYVRLQQPCVNTHRTRAQEESCCINDYN